MSESYILTADDVRALGGDPADLKRIGLTDRLAIHPMPLTGEHDGKFALAVDVVQRSPLAASLKDRLATLPTANLTVENFKWFADAQQAEAMEVRTNERTR